jgi:hypothetical protein
MTHGNPHEEAEHASHHASDPFDRRVAMSMVVIAALLAAVKVLGHRTHTDTLNYQIEANVNHTKESDQWNYFQAKKNRQYLYEAQADLLAYLGRKTGPMAAGLFDLDKVVAVGEQEKPKPQKKKKKGELTAEDEKEVAALQQQGLPRDAAERAVSWRSQARTYREDAQKIEVEANELQKEAKKFQAKSHHKHEQSFFFDVGELFVELAIVLCSVAILTKLMPFWYGGMLVCLLGLAVVGMGFFMVVH